MRVVGRRVRAIDWRQRTSGAATYTEDVALDGSLVGAILRSPYPHAEIRSIDVSAALAIPGVQAVVTAADLPPGTRYLHAGPAHADRPPLATDRVRYIGQEVAAVAADSPESAEAARAAIRVRYRVLPAPVSTAAALADNAPVLHERAGGRNLAMVDSGVWGDPATGRRLSAVAVEGTYRYPKVAHACMERSTTAARWTGGTLELWTTTQAPWYVALEVANALGVDVDDIVCRDIGVGGGFGARSKIGEHELIAALLARRAGKPVRLALSREEEFSATKTRHGFEVTTRLHATGDGRLCLIEGDIVVENGAYNHSGPLVTKVGIKTMGALYQPEAVTWRARLVDTAVQPGGQFRGYGGPQVAFALESQVDELSERLGIDPIDLRVRNANPPGSTALCGARIGSARLVECLGEVRAALDWDHRRSTGRQPGRGLGVAAGMHGSGSHVGPGTNESSAAVQVDEDGRAQVSFGSLDTGTGQRTICALVAAEELGLEPADVEVTMGHAPEVPHDAGAWSSRGTHMAGHAVRAAASSLADQFRRSAADKLDSEPTAVLLADGRATAGERSIEIGELVAAADQAQDGRLRAEATYVEDRMEPFGADHPTPNFSASYTFCAHGAEVEVDELTGRLRVVSYAAAHDVGRALNPGATEGQIVGGVVMALGAVLGEEVIHEAGRVVNPAFINYPVPRASDVPEIRAILVEGPEEAGPYDAKSVGEMPTYPVAAAVANAVYDAAGIRLRDLPFTPDKVLAALAARDARRRPVRPVWRRPSRWWIAMVRALYPRGLHAVLHRYGTRLARRVPRRALAEITAPTAVDGVVGDLGGRQGDAVVLAGNTDLSLQRRQGLASPVRLVALSEVAELRRLEWHDDGSLVIGAGVSLTHLIDHTSRRLPVLADAARTIASPQVRTVATVGGNLLQAKRCWFFRNGFDCYKRGGVTCPCYAVDGDHRFHHAIVDGHRCQAVTPSDLATVMVALEAQATVAGPKGEWTTSVSDLYRGPGETRLAHDDLLVRLTVPATRVARPAAFEKLALWEGDFAVVSAALSVSVESSGRWHDPSIVLGAVAPVPLRLRRAERRLDGSIVDAAGLRGAVADELTRVAHPLARNGWKVLAAEGIGVRAFEHLRERLAG